MTAAGAILRVGLRQLLAAKRTWALAALALLPVPVMAIAQRTMTDAEAFEFLHEAPQAMLFIIVIPVISLVLASSALGDERSSHTLSFLVLRPIPRIVIVAAKGVAAWAAIFALTGVGALATSAALGLATGEWAPLGPMVLAAAINSVAYTALFLPLGYLVSRAVLVGLAYLFIWEAGLSLAISNLATFSVSRIGLSAYAALVSDAREFLEEPLGAVVPGAGGAVAKAVGIALLGAVATAALLRRRDQAAPTA